MSTENIEGLYTAMTSAGFNVEWYESPMDDTLQIRMWNSDYTLYRVFADSVDERGNDYPGFESCLYEAAPDSDCSDGYAGGEVYFDTVLECIRYLKVVSHRV